MSVNATVFVIAGTIGKYIHEVMHHHPAEIIRPYDLKRVWIRDLTYMGAAVHAAFDRYYPRRIRTLGHNGRFVNDRFTVACHMAHRRAWQALVDSGNDWGLILEHDAVMPPSYTLPRIQGIVEATRERGVEWGTINMSPSYIYCKTQKSILRVNDTTLIESGSSMGTTGYVLRRAAASALLQHSFPYVMPVDALITFMARNGVLRQLTATPPVVDHHKAMSKHDSFSLPLCDENEQSREGDVSDSTLLRRIRDSPHFLNGPSWRPLTHLCRSRVGHLCSTGAGIYPRSRTLSAALERMGVSSFVVWGLRGDSHTHNFVHEAIFEYWRDQIYSCYVPSGYVDPVPCGEGDDDLLSNAIVFASPKHMVWSSDPTLKNLPQRGDSFYIFHELLPTHFVKTRRVAQWIVRGRDGNNPLLEAEYGALRRRYACPATQVECRYVSDNVLVAPWAIQATPLSPWSQTPGRINFVGTIWSVNAAAFCGLVEGCAARGVQVHRYGMNKVPASLPCRRDFVDHPAKLRNSERDQLVMQGPFVPCIQGPPHTDPDDAYVSDRFLYYASMRVPVATNNPRVADWFNLTAVEPAHMCRAGGELVSPAYTSNHTLEFRFSSLLSLFQLAAQPDLASKGLGTQQATHQ